MTKSPEPAHGQRVQMACMRVPWGVEDLGPETLRRSGGPGRAQEGPRSQPQAQGPLEQGLETPPPPPPHETAALCCFREARPHRAGLELRGHIKRMAPTEMMHGVI